MPISAHGKEIIVTVSNGGALSQIAVDDQDAPADVAWRYLGASKGIKSIKDLKNASIQTLKDAGSLPYRRVEVNGVSTTDDTSAKLPGMFDKQIKMSYENAPEPSRKIAQWGAYLFRYALDVISAVQDMDGQPTEHAQKVLSAIAGRQVDEIIAHSWGTEAVYAAILSGYILPPKKLILVGIPEENRAQWSLLAKYTGIEVHVVGFSTDKVQITGNIMDQFVTGLPRDPAMLEALWQRRCAQQTRCIDPRKGGGSLEYDVNAMPPREEALWPAEPFGLHSKAYRLPGMDHDRIEYYKWLAQRKLLNTTIAQLDRFNAAQRDLITAQAAGTFSEAVDKARDLISQAKIVGAAEEAQQFRQKAIQDAEAARPAQECLAIDAKIAKLLIGIVTKACSDPDNFTNDDVRELSDLPDDRSYICDSNFPHGYYPVSQLNANCQRPLFDNLWNRLTQRSWFHAPTVLSVLRSREGFPTPVQATLPPPIPAAADRTVEIAHLKAQIQYMRNLVRWACANNGRLSEDDGRSYRTAYHDLLENSTGSGAIPGLEPISALSGWGDAIAI